MQINNQFSSIRGKIRVLMMAVTNIDGTDQYERILAVLHTLSEHTGLLVWCNSQSVQATFHTWLQEKGVEAELRLIGEIIPRSFHCMLLAPKEKSDLTFYSHWVRDPFLWKWDEPGALTLLGSVSAKNEDSLWPYLHLKALNLEGLGPVAVHGRAVPVAGGNILFDEDFVMVGAKQFRDGLNSGDEQIYRQRLTDVMNGTGNSRPFVRLIEIGDAAGQEPPKLIHLDLYMSLTGARIEGRYVILVGRATLAAGSEAPDTDLIRSIEQINKYLDAVTEQLIQSGFYVRRNPIPVLQKRNEAESYLCAYNNCLTEVSEDKSVVWLAKLSYQQEAAPYFNHLKQLEDENVALWKELNFEVRLIEANFHTILDDQGSLHCITNEVLRG